MEGLCKGVGEKGLGSGVRVGGLRVQGREGEGGGG